jgi:hypothetical protein
MMRRHLAILVGVLTIGLGSVPASAQSSITSSLATPHYLDVVTFTITYPREAARKVGQRQKNNPDVDVRCYAGATWVFWQITGAATTTQHNDGTRTSITGPVVLGGYSGGGLYWPPTAADCVATLYYFSDGGGGLLVYHYLAELRFTVSGVS